MRARSTVGGTLLCGLAALVIAGTARAADPFTLKSPTFAENAFLEKKNGGSVGAFPSCVGDNVSPALEWSNAPAKTKSFALLLLDPEGAGGFGNSHMVVYGIAPSVTSFAEGELGAPSSKFVGGKNFRGDGNYFGPCPPAGVGFHHYLFVVIATDVEPTALAAGMTRDELKAALKDHVVGSAGLATRFQHP